MMQNNISNTKVFVVLANRRTGSNYLMKVLNSFPDIEFFGEIYHWDTVWMPFQRKQDYAQWLKDTKNAQVNIGQKPFEDKELVKLNHTNPDYFLDFFTSNVKQKYGGFKIFPEHLSWQKLEAYLLSKENIKKVLLTRNLLDVYISDKIMQKTQRSQEYDTSHIKLNIDCIEFKKWYFDNQAYYSRIELYLKRHSQKLLKLSYEDIHGHDSDQEKINFVFSWLNQHEFDIKDKPESSSYTKKQDRRSSSLEKVQNAKVLSQYLFDNNLQHLIQI